MSTLTHAIRGAVAAAALVLSTGAAATAATTSTTAPATAPPTASSTTSTSTPPTEPSVESLVTCSPGVGDGRRTVLLVHGTGTTAHETWSWNWVHTLPLMGYGVCTIDVPDRELTNFTGSAEYVADAVRYVSQRAGGKISLIGHSQGGTLVAWVAKFFPDVAAHTDDVISLAGDFGGTVLMNALCADGACPDVAWQLAISAKHLRALRNAPFPTGPSFSSIYSMNDELVQPQPLASTLPGASNVSIQDVCGVRPIEHGGIVADSVAYALVKDALDHDGPVRRSRVSLTGALTACATVNQPGTDPTGYALWVPTVVALADGLALGGQPDATQEPALPAYAARYAS